MRRTGKLGDAASAIAWHSPCREREERDFPLCVNAKLTSHWNGTDLRFPLRQERISGKQAHADTFGSERWGQLAIAM